MEITNSDCPKNLTTNVKENVFLGFDGGREAGRELIYKSFKVFRWEPIELCQSYSLGYGSYCPPLKFFHLNGGYIVISIFFNIFNLGRIKEICTVYWRPIEQGEDGDDKTSGWNQNLCHDFMLLSCVVGGRL